MVKDVKRCIDSWNILNNLLNERGITAYEIVKSSKGQLSNPLFSDWKRCKSMPKFDKLKIIADFLGVSPYHILGLENDIEDIINEKDDDIKIFECYKKLSDENKYKVSALIMSLYMEQTK